MYSLDAGQGRLRMQCDLTIFQAAQLWPAFGEALEQTRVLEVDLAGVGEFDSAGLQLLLMLRQAAIAGGRGLRLSNPGAAVVETLALVGASGLLDEVPPAPGSDLQ